jgi:hypothetical protein
MATPASRATSVIVGPEWRRFAGFREDGTNVPFYCMRLTITQRALSAQERITGLLQLNTPNHTMDVDENPQGAQIYTGTRLGPLQLTLSVTRGSYDAAWRYCYCSRRQRLHLRREYAQKSLFVPSRRVRVGSLFSRILLAASACIVTGLYGQAPLAAMPPWGGTTGTLTERRLARSR